MPATGREPRWAPFVVTGAVMAAALALDVATGNQLWFWYTWIGIGVLLAAAAIYKHTGAPIPGISLWGAGLTAGLHYVGGSLSGLHTLGGVNGLYFAFPWWDNLTHVLGAASVALVAAALLDPRLAGEQPILLGFLCVAIAAFAGVLIELYEFAGFAFFGTVDQGYYTNNALDLYYNVLGGVIGAGAYLRWGSRETGPGPRGGNAV